MKHRFPWNRASSSETTRSTAGKPADRCASTAPGAEIPNAPDHAPAVPADGSTCENGGEGAGIGPDREMLPTYHPEFEVWMHPHEIVEIVGGPLDGDLAGAPVGTLRLELAVKSTGRITTYRIEGCYAHFEGYVDASKEPTS